MTDTGKHSALRQTSDGSFEIVFEASGLQEVSEDRASTSESQRPEPSVEPAHSGPSRRVIGLSVVGLVVLLLVALVGWFALSPSGPKEAEPEVVPGFRPYGGGPDSADAPPRNTPSRVVLPPLEDDEVPVEAVPADEITESEPGWELQEPEPALPGEEGEVLEAPAEPGIEEVPAEGMLPTEEVLDEVPEQLPQGQTTGAEEVPSEEQGAVDDVGDARIRAFANSKGLDALRVRDISRGVKMPRAPAFSNNPLGTDRFRALPIRTLDPNASAEESGESEGEIVDEIVEE